MKNQTTEEFLEQLRSLNVKLWREGDGLRYKAPENVLSANLLRQLQERKPEILAFFQQAQRNVRAALPPLVKVSRDGELPLSFAQQRLWLLAQFESDSSAYNMSRAFYLKGELNLTALEQSFKEIIRRHEVLRTVFPTVEGQPIQVILSDIPFQLSVSDAQGIPGEKWKSEIQQWLTCESQQIFNLSEGPLLSVKLLRLATTEQIMLLNVHHIVSDGWSMGIFMEEISTLYPAFVNNTSPSLPPLPIQYLDFALWQRQWLTGEILDNQISYWHQQLAHLPPILELPTDKFRPSLETFSGTHQSFVLSKQLTQQIKALCRQEEVTLFMGLLTAFSILLFRYSGQEDIAIGSPIANRNHREIETLIGCFVNTLVMGIDLKANPTVSELLKRVRQTTKEAYAHQDLPFEKLVEQLQPERSLSHSPLFQVMFVLQNVPQPPLELAGVTLTPVEIEKGTTQFDLTLSINETKEGLKGQLEYNTDLFEAATINRMIGHFQTLLEGMVANPQSKVAQLPLLTEAERHQLLVEWNDTKADYPKNKCIHQLFEEQVERTPNAVAVVFEDQQLTYQELNQKANQLAHYLQSLGVEAETLVGICLERSLEMVVGLLAILKAGAAYLPLDPNYPYERLAFMLDNAQAFLLLTQTSQVQFLPTSVPTVCLDKVEEQIVQQSQDIPKLELTTSNLAYVIYTSGSTGKPKGIAMNHLTLTNLITWQVQQSKASAGSKTLQFSPLSFDVATQEIFSTWCSGGILVLISEALRQDPRILLNELQTKGIERLFLPFVALQQLAGVAYQSRQYPKHLQEVITAGEQLQITSEIRYWFQQQPHCRLCNQYGPSETHVVTALTLSDSVKDWPILPAIGRPIVNSQVYILDKQCQPVPIGIPGEVHIGGDNLARGYVNYSRLTAEKFIDNPFNNDKSKLYKTGDLGCYCPDKNIKFLGRIDNQVKLRGFRIELGEIEAVLSQHPQVGEVTVMVREDQPDDKRLVAYVVADESESISPQLRQFLAEKLPNYMIPSAFVILPSLPLTPNGKIDRRALPAPNSFNLEQQLPWVAPKDQLEQDLIEIWEEVLGINPIRVRDNFFELGGHSLLAVKLLHHIEKKLGYKLSLGLLFENATIEKIAHNIRNNSDFYPWKFLISIQPKGDKPPLFAIHNEIPAYHNLAHYLGEEQPIYGLSDPRFVQQVVLSESSVETLATRYLEEIQRLQPCGPYYLIGISFGGIIAFEIAQQLFKKGESVAFLGLLDSLTPNFRKSLSLLQRFHIHWQELVEKGIFTYMNNRIKSQLHKRKRFLKTYKLMTKINQNKERINEISLSSQSDVFNFINRKLITNYITCSYQGKITLFKAQQTQELINRYPKCFDEKLGWGDFASGGLDIYDLPGKHIELLQEPYVKALAEKLGNILDLTGDVVDGSVAKTVDHR